MSINPATGAIDWLVPQTAAANSPFTVTIAVSDGMAATEQTFQITAQAVNVAPIIFSTPVLVGAVGADYAYDVNANDLDGDTVTYSLTEAPSGMHIDAQSGLITWQPAAGQDGQHTVTVKAADPADLFDEQTFTIEVAPCPDAPEFTSAPQPFAGPEIAYAYQAEATSNGGTITYSLDIAPGGMTIDAGSGLIQWTPTTGQLGVHDVTVLATRDGVCPTPQSYTVEVKTCSLAVGYTLPPLVPGQSIVVLPDLQANCGPVTFRRVSGTPGITVVADTGELRWTPVVGAFIVEIEATDAFGLVETVVLSGNVLPQSAPQITSTPPFTAQPDLLYSYLVIANDPDNDPITFGLDESPAGMVINDQTGLIEWTPTASQLGTHPVAVRVADNRGAGVIQSFPVTVSADGTNVAPKITTTPPLTVIAGRVYAYDVDATDDNGDPLTYALDIAPAGMTIDDQTGEINWTTAEDALGVHPIRITVQDGRGGVGWQAYDLTVKHNTPPQIDSAPIFKAIVGIEYVYPVLAGDVDGDTLLYALDEAPADMTIDAATGEIRWTPRPGDDGDHDVRIAVTDPFGGRAEQVFAVTVFADANADLYPPEVIVTAEPPTVNVGEPVAITVQAMDDFAIATLVLTVNDAPVTLGADGRAVFTPSAPGAYVAKAVATDPSGKTGSSSTDFAARVPGDETAPTVVITAPALDSELAAPMDIVGTASDANLYKYTLAYRQVGDDEYIEFAAGYQSVTNGVLGKLDPTMMLNGLHEIRLRAQDLNGNIAAYTVVYNIVGDLKIGNFTITFKDLDIPVSGVPVTVTRTYDSRKRSKGDFGYGWTLDIASLKVEENKTIADDWEQVQGGSWLPVYGLFATRRNIVSLTLPNGQVERFEAKALPASQALIPITFLSGLQFIPLGDTTSTLTVSGQGLPDFYLGDTPGTGTLVNINGQDADLTTFHLKLKDGTQFTFVGAYGSRTARLQSIRDLNGNSIQITSNGITHSSGLEITFERDADNRITAIVDPDGKRITYGYDARGDLISVTDQIDRVTRFTYNRRHGLIEILGPDGTYPARNIYDDAGRLIATIDAEGNRIEFSHDIDARQEVVWDRLGQPTIHEYDQGGNVTATTNALGERTEYTYDARGNTLTTKDPLGHITTSTYDARDNLLTETDPLGNTTTYTYDAQSRRLTETDAEGRLTRYEYDAGGNLVKVTDPMGHVSRMTYNGAGNLVSQIDPIGGTTTYQYDAYGRLISKTDPVGATMTYTYDSSGRKLSETVTRTTPSGPQAITRSNDYDDFGQRTETTDGEGFVFRTEYTALGKTSATVDQLGNRMEFEYDARGNLLVKRYPDGSEELSTYDAEGRRLSFTTPDGRTTRYAYDSVGRLIRTTAPNGGETETVYDAAGRAIRSIDPLGHITRTEYDAAGQDIAVIDPLGNRVERVYDRTGLMTRETDALGRTLEQEFTLNRQPARMVFPNGLAITYQYDDAGRRISERSSTGVETRFEYDAVGRLVKIINPLGFETRYQYDEAGAKVAMIDAEGRTTRYEYDRMGRQTREIRPLGMAEQVAYGPSGRTESVTDYNGATNGFAYDENGQIVSKNLSNGRTVAYDYLEPGRIGSITDHRGTTGYEFDTAGRLIRRTDPGGAQISYAWDEAGNRIAVTTPAGTTAYGYDELNRLKTVTDPDNGVTTYSYDAVGNRKGVAYPNGATSTYDYDSLNRLTSLVHRDNGGTVIASYAYTLDAFGNRNRVVEHDGRTVDYQYDALLRLTRETVTAAGGAVTTINYTYDRVGNHLSRTIQTTAQRIRTDYTYDANDRLLTETRVVTLVDAGRGRGAVSYADAAVSRQHARWMAPTLTGAMLGALLMPLTLLRSRRHGVGARLRRRRVLIRTIVLVVLPVMALEPRNVQAVYVTGVLRASVGTAALAQAGGNASYTCTWDANGNLLTRTDGSNTDLFTYDAENRLATASMRTDGRSDEISYTYDAFGNRMSKTLNGVTTTYLVDTTSKYVQVLMETTNGQAVSYVRGDDLISMKRGTAARYYHPDGAGSTRALTDTAATVTDRYAYDGFGGLLSRSGSTTNDFLYTGEQYDANVGFYHLRARMYDPGTGRFTTADPFRMINQRDPLAFHKYMYAYNNPVNFNDPSGLATLLEISISIAVIAILILAFGQALVTAPSKAATLPIWGIWNAVNIASAPPEVRGEVGWIIIQFYKWAVKTHSNWQGTWTLGPGGYILGRSWACGDHVQQLMQHLTAQPRYPLQHFDFRVFESNVRYAPGSGTATTITGLVHTYLIAHNTSNNITINLDSWYWWFFAPYMPAPYYWSVDVSDSANYSGYYGSSGPPSPSSGGPEPQAPPPGGNAPGL